MPATSFAEYHPTATIPGARGKPIKAANWFRLVGEEERPPFAFAGLCRMWHWEKEGLRKKADDELATANTPTLAMAFLTTAANEVVKPIHPKAMPVLLTPDQFDIWLTGDVEEARNLQRPLPDEQLEIAFIGEKQD